MKHAVHLGDCLEEHKKIKPYSVDLILMDPPYGNMTNSGLYGAGLEWDIVINPEDIFAMADTILRNKGKLIVFSQEPYTSKIIAAAPFTLPFLYRLIWEKDTFANALGCKKAPVSFYEDILVCQKQECYDAVHPGKEVMRGYFLKYGKEKIENLIRAEGRYTTEATVKIQTIYFFWYWQR